MILSFGVAYAQAANRHVARIIAVAFTAPPIRHDFPNGGQRPYSLWQVCGGPVELRRFRFGAGRSNGSARPASALLRRIPPNRNPAGTEYLTERDLGEDFAAGEAIAEEAARRAELIGN
jgi:hypothetical protein